MGPLFFPPDSHLVIPASAIKAHSSPLLWATCTIKLVSEFCLSILALHQRAASYLLALHQALLVVQQALPPWLLHSDWVTLSLSIGIYWFHWFKASVQFSSVHSVVSHSLRPHGLQHTKLPCPSPTPGVYSNSCPLSQWCHPTISSSVVPFSSCLQSFPASGSFPMSQLFTSGGQSTGDSASASVLPTFRTDLLRMDWLDPLAIQGTLKSLLQHHSSKASVLRHSAFFKVQLSIYTWPLEKP